jgi:c-di-GMP-binding flagellar brake protein YcgR
MSQNNKEKGIDMEKSPYDNSDNAEKRMHPRSPYIANVSYRLVEDENDSNPLKGKGITQNISYAGMCLLLNTELPLGTILELKFDHTENDSNPIVTRVKIVWLKKTETEYLAGVKFLVD